MFVSPSLISKITSEQAVLDTGLIQIVVCLVIFAILDPYSNHIVNLGHYANVNPCPIGAHS